MTILLLAAACLAVAVYLVGEAATHPSRLRASSIRRASTYGSSRLTAAADGGPGFRERAIDPLVRRVARVVLRVNPKTSTELVAQRLLAAGLAGNVTPTGFLAAKGIAICVGALLGLALGTAAGPVLGAVLVVAFAAIGFVLPDSLVSSRARRRREQVRAELPDALDLLAVSVEAGLGFDGAVAKVTDHTTGALSDELALMLGEMRVGESRHDALRSLERRLSTPEVSAFVRALIQADQLGISLGRLLRVQAADARLRRQAAAEERAMKTPIKMLFPTVLFIFPAMFLVVLGPALLNLKQVF